MLKCPHCQHKSNKVEIQTTEIGQVKWLNPKIGRYGAVEDLGDKWIYEGGETVGEKGYKLLCGNCKNIIKEIDC